MDNNKELLSKLQQKVISKLDSKGIKPEISVDSNEIIDTLDFGDNAVSVVDVINDEEFIIEQKSEGKEIKKIDRSESIFKRGPRGPRKKDNTTVSVIEVKKLEDLEGIELDAIELDAIAYEEEEDIIIDSLEEDIEFVVEDETEDVEEDIIDFDNALVGGSYISKGGMLETDYDDLEPIDSNEYLDVESEEASWDYTETDDLEDLEDIGDFEKLPILEETQYESSIESVDTGINTELKSDICKEEVLFEDSLNLETSIGELTKELPPDTIKEVIYTKGMPLIEFLRENPKIRLETEVLEYYSKETIKESIKKGIVLIKKGKLII